MLFPHVLASPRAAAHQAVEGGPCALDPAVVAGEPRAGGFFSYDEHVAPWNVARCLHAAGIPRPASLLGLASTAKATLSSLGGELRRVSLALTGALAQDWLERLRFDAAVLGASGIDPEAGAYTTELGEAGVKIEALRRSRLRILVVHGEKWGRPAAVHFAPWTAFHHVVTERSALGPDRAAALAQAKVLVHAVGAR